MSGEQLDHADALRAAAAEIERELICCDAYEQGPKHLRSKHPHLICYWSGAARAIVLDHAKRADETVPPDARHVAALRLYARRKGPLQP